MGSKAGVPRRKGPAPTEERRAQIREAARIFRDRQREKGLYQCVFWLTLTQAAAVREWIRKGADLSVFRKRETVSKENENGGYHGDENEKD
jgi:antirestriction protein ArdC